MHVILVLKKKKANLFIYFQFFAPLFQKLEIVFLVLIIDPSILYLSFSHTIPGI